ncbi:glucosamine-6-phosphate deaminase [Rhodobacterales bacterium HKCCE3408]|nr:glucosamine-6-phosphate deaminase [Rhodobacterales bacterium HKCCE3408]
MRLIVCADPREATRAVVDRVVGAIRDRPDVVLGLAAGGTMEWVYDGIVAAHEGGLSLARVTSFNLDEYVGLPPEHAQSYHSYMRARLFDRTDIAPGRTYLPRGDGDPGAAAEYEALIAQHGPIDLQLLGIGQNGHIGFNEPGSDFASRTREVALAEATRTANARYFGSGETPPETAVTMGIGTILEARSIVLLALGDGKADAVAAMVEGPVTEACPASALQTHPDATVVVDRDAARLLSRTAI